MKKTKRHGSASSPKNAQGRHFYSHITDTKSLKISLEELGLPAHEIDHLVELADDNLHHTVLDAILSELSEEDKKLFLSHLAESKHDKIWEILHSKVENIEEKIQIAAAAIKEELHKDIKDIKNQSVRQAQDKKSNIKNTDKK